MGAPLGNTNGRNARVFRDSLNKVLATYESDERKVKRGEALHKINTSLVEQALDGKEFAIKEVANRTDGKPIQVQEIYSEINASWVIATFRARLGNDEQTRELLKAAKADNLLPVLEQLIIEQPKALAQE